MQMATSAGVPDKPSLDGIGEKWATGRATLDELKDVAALELSDFSALRLDVVERNHLFVLAGRAPAQDADPLEDVRPGLLPDANQRGFHESRGPQKRHRILAYVRSHPEEIRPFRLQSHR